MEALDYVAFFIVMGLYGLLMWYVHPSRVYLRSQSEEKMDNLKDHVNGISEEDFQSDHWRRFQDVVNNPQHYTVGGYEALDVIKAKLTPEEYRGYCKGNILKYIMRSNYKGHHDTDCDKAEYYAKELANALDNKEVKEQMHWREPINPATWTNEKQVREEDSEGPPF